MILATALLLLVCIPSASTSGYGAYSSLPAQKMRTQEHVDPCHAASRQRLLVEFSNVTGLFNTTGWWNAANVLTTLVHDALLSLAHSTEGEAVEAMAYAKTVLTMVNTTYNIYGPTTHFLDDYNDDEGWWGLMFTAAHDLAIAISYPSEAAKFLSTSRFLWEDMKNSWNASAAACGGGIWWSKTIHYKNAIANELFIALAAELAWRDAAHPSDQASLIAFAEVALSWFNHSGMRNQRGTINDGLTPQCANNNQTVWSYNQGVILGGLAALYRTLASLGRDAESVVYLLDEAVSIYYAAVAALANYSDDRSGEPEKRSTITTIVVDAPPPNGEGILRDPCEPNCGADGCQFKGVFLRNVMQLAEVLSSLPYRHDGKSSWSIRVAAFQHDVESMRRFTHRNAESICANDTAALPVNASTSGWLGIQWAGPFLASSASTCTTSSAFDCLVAKAWFDSNEM